MTVVDERRRTGQDEGWAPTGLDLEILSLLARGLTIDAIARRIGVSDRTVRRRLRTVADELGVDSSIEAVVHAVRTGLI
ncbi:LuxR C-terminal-related transcriptional regulator [Nocardioides carbamazepini]|uniref:helix-turn-helix domain-containing protein n=1 Tax=Nocardioides carbamazepini TaxID=2854259 RepID=UPI00214A4A43|nr:LuxR C-terminal-related transcriptional regulator [Nocardioides carbamazepini]MCR1784291.1 LuxR C-terminal-related transcriptional regulator [Nocardioides carbamazepini]